MNEHSVRTPKIVVFNAGRQKRKAIAEFKQGIGPLVEEVQAAAAQAAAEQGMGEKEVLPVVVLYRKRTQKRRGLIGEILRAL